MKNHFLLVPVPAILGLLCGAAQAKGPVLDTPGTAKWAKESTATGTRTVFTLKANTVLDWENLNVPAGSELDFNFVGGKSVLNFLHGTGTHVIDGTVTSNGLVAFFSPTADLEVNGTILAKSVVLSTLRADPKDFNDGNGYELKGESDFNYLSINGTVEANGGEVIVAGERVEIGGDTRIRAFDGVRLGGGRDFTVAATGDKRLHENSGEGYVLHLGDTRSSRIEVAAGREILNQGRLDAKGGKIFLSVGSEGNITNDSTGIIVGNAEFNGRYDPKGTVFTPDEGDSVPVVADGTLTIPKLHRPDGTKVATPDTLSYSVPMSASGDAGRDGAAPEATRKGAPRPTVGKSILQRSSFFGMRGGSAAPEKKDH